MVTLVHTTEGQHTGGLWAALSGISRLDQHQYVWRSLSLDYEKGPAAIFTNDSNESDLFCTFI